MAGAQVTGRQVPLGSRLTGVCQMFTHLGLYGRSVDWQEAMLQSSGEGGPEYSPGR